MKKTLQTIFSLKRNDNHKVLTILGIKMKFKSPKKVTIKKIYDLLVATNEQVENINYKQNIVMDYFLDAKNAKRASGGLRQRQLQEIELLKEFIRICDKHNLEYWLDYGSLLGAKRHGGFVPWDDDLDVSMDKENLDKFKEIVENEISEKYIYRFYCTCYNRLLFKEDNGAFLDIYEYSNIDNKYRINEDNIQFQADRFSTPYNVLFPLAKINFEGIDVKCPNDIDTYLRIKYGNYENLPKSCHNVPGHNPIEEYKVFYPEERV